MDRLAELRRFSGAAAVAIDVEPEPQNAKGGSGKLFGGSSGKQASAATGAGMANLEAGNGGPPAKESFLAAFLKDVEQVKKDIQAIKEAIREMNSIQSESLVAQNAHEAALSTALQAVIHETNPKAACAKAPLQTMREDTNKLASAKGGAPSEYRIRENLFNTMTRKFVDVMKEYQNTQTKYKSFIKKKVER
jgi:hypothetical protein